MERSLHQALKLLVARDAASTEVRVGSYRIDAIDSDGTLTEVQCAPLAAIRSKVLKMRESYDLRIIKPLVACKTIEVLATADGPLLRKRRSPKKLDKVDLCTELLHFTQCFPHPRVKLEFWLVDVVEIRVDQPKRGRRKAYRTVDVRLRAINEQLTVRTPADLVALLPMLHNYLEPFCTLRLATDAGIERWKAQQIAFVLQRCGAIECVGKSGNSRLYRVIDEVVSPRTGAAPAAGRRRRRA